MKKEDISKTLMLFTLYMQAVEWSVLKTERPVDYRTIELEFMEWAATNWDSYQDLEEKVMKRLDSDTVYGKIPEKDRYPWKRYQ